VSDLMASEVDLARRMDYIGITVEGRTFRYDPDSSELYVDSRFPRNDSQGESPQPGDESSRSCYEGENKRRGESGHVRSSCAPGKMRTYKITLNVTERCNLRCSYCVFSTDAYKHYRSHGEIDAQFEYNAKLLDRVFTTIPKAVIKRIAFFGSEPLLAFRLIKRVVEYIESSYPDHVCKYSITTNGLLLSQLRLSFLVNHDFDMAVSLDAPKALHDLRRVTPNNSATYDLIMSSLTYFRNTHPQAYSKKLRLSATYQSSEEVHKGLDEFARLGIFNVDYGALVYDISRDPIGTRNIAYRDEYLNSHFMQAFEKRDYNRMWLYGKYFLSFCSMFDRRMIFPKGYDPEYSFTHFCIPFSKAIDVQANGELSFCNLVDHIRFDYVTPGEFMPRNDVIRSYMDSFEKFHENECKNCSIRRICSLCWVHYFNAKGELSGDRLRQHCVQERRKVGEFLSIYVQLKLKDPDIFQLLDENPPTNTV